MLRPPFFGWAQANAGAMFYKRLHFNCTQPGKPGSRLACRALEAMISGMSKAPDFATAEQATVRLPSEGGRGVFVPGGFILTAAHCIKLDTNNYAVLEDTILETVQSGDRRYRTRVCAFDPISDIAVLEKLDDQTFVKDAKAFDLWCAETKPLQVAEDLLKAWEESPIWIYNHSGTWVKGSAEVTEVNSQTLWIEVEELIEGGASGGPVINECGELVAIASLGGESPNDLALRQPRPSTTLPTWIWRRILAGSGSLESD